MVRLGPTECNFPYLIDDIAPLGVLFRPILEFAVCTLGHPLVPEQLRCVPLHICGLAETGYLLRTVLHMVLLSGYRVFHFRYSLL